MTESRHPDQDNLCATTAAYDSIANLWADKYQAMPPEVETLGSRLLGHLPPRPHVLDVGCGAGRDSSWFEKQGASVTGIDLSPNMVAQAAKVVRGELRVMDMRELEFANETFDGVWCMAALLHVAKSEVTTVLRGFACVTRPQGVIGLGVQRGVGEGWEESKLGGIPIRRYFARYELDEWRELLEDADLRTIAEPRGEEGNTRWIHTLVEKVPR